MKREGFTGFMLAVSSGSKTGGPTTNPRTDEERRRPRRLLTLSHPRPARTPALRFNRTRPTRPTLPDGPPLPEGEEKRAVISASSSLRLARNEPWPRSPEGCQKVAGGRSAAQTPGGGGLESHPGGMPEALVGEGFSHPSGVHDLRRAVRGCHSLRCVPPPATFFHPFRMKIRVHPCPSVVKKFPPAWINASL